MSPSPPSGGSRALARLGAWSFRRRWRVLGLWVAALAAAIALLGPLAGEFTSDFEAPGSDSAAAATLIAERFGGGSPDTIDVVWRAEGGAMSSAARERVDPLLAEAATLPGLGPAGPPEVSPDGTTAVARLGVTARNGGEVPLASAERLLELAGAAEGGGLRVELSGWRIGDAEGAEVSPEAVGFLIAAAVLVLTFGSVLAAGLPLVAALFGLGIGATLVGLLATVMDTPDFATPLAAMIGIGVGIDYALLVLTRYRAALAAGRAPEAAVTEAAATAGRSVVVAGLTVVIAMMGLFAMGLSYLNAVALAASMSVLVVMAAALTLLPAMLGILGRRLDLLRVPGRRLERGRAARGRPSRWVAWSGLVQRHPWRAAVAGLALAVVLATPVTGFRLGFPDAGNDPAPSTTRQAYDLVADAFGPGANGPLVVATTLGGDDREANAALAELRGDLAATPGVASVAPPRLSPGGDAALVAVVPESSPQSAETADLVSHLRESVLPGAGPAGAGAHVGGVTASSVDQGAHTLARLPLLIGAVLGLSFVLLVAAFRSVAVALKAGVMNLLSIGAAYGVVALVAQGGWAGRLVGVDTPVPVPAFVPVMMFAILFGLSMDYEVFLLSRIREHWLRHGDTARAVSEGLASTARVITAAAAIMVAVFGAFALTADLFLKLFGIGLATAILVDATLIRLLLVPATMQIMGRANWWLPRWLERILPAGPRGPELAPVATRD